MFTLPILALAGCGSSLSTNENNVGEFEEVADTTPPEIVHTEVTESLPLGESVPIEATVTDLESGVLFVRLYYKNETENSGSYRNSVMTAGASPDVFVGEIPGDEQNSGGMNYYIEATDYAQNLAWAPTDGVDDPFHFRLYVPEG